MTQRISEKARQILNHLKSTARPLSPKAIATALELNDDTVQSLLVSLRDRKLIKDHKTSTIQFYQLTPEGQQFAQKGLPEVRLISILLKSGGETSVSSLSKEKSLVSTEQQLALGWARRNGWITISKRGEETWMHLSPKTQDSMATHPLQLALNAAAESGQLHQNQVDFDAKTWKSIHQDLEKRQLAELVTQQMVTVVITPEGSHALDLSALQRDMIQDLTPDLMKSGQWKDRAFLPYNLQAPTSPLYPGKKHPYIEFVDRVRRILIGLGFQEIFTLSLTSTEEQHKKMRLEGDEVDESKFIKLGYSAEQNINMIREWLLPEALKSLVNNRNRKFPQKIFEINYVIRADKTKDVLCQNRLAMSCLIANDPADFTEIKQVIVYLLECLGIKDYEFKKSRFYW